MHSVFAKLFVFDKDVKIFFQSRNLSFPKGVKEAYPTSNVGIEDTTTIVD